MRFVVCVVLVFFITNSFAQRTFKLKVVDEHENELPHKLGFVKEINDSLAVYNEAEKIISHLQFGGYLFAELTSVEFRGTDVKIKVAQGQPFQWVALKAGNMSFAAQQAVGFKEKNFEAKSFDINSLQAFFKALLAYYENSGYPFAVVSLDQISVTNEGVSAIIKVNPHHQIVYDAIKIVGNGQVGQKYLQSYLNIKEGAPYSELVVARVETKLKEIPFLSVAKPTEVAFTNQKAKVTVYVTKKNANQFDGIVGLQQETSTGKLQVVGNAKLHLQNVLKLGERLNFDYQGLPNSSQLLDLKANIPHVLSTAFGLSPSLYMLKQDTSFLNVNTKLGLNYILRGNNSFQFFLENKATNLLAAERYQNNASLPSILDSKSTFYGLAIAFDNLDYRINPKKGISISADLAVGLRKIKRNSAIDPQLYNGLDLSGNSYRFFAQFNYFKAFSNRVVIALSNQSAFLTGSQLLENELFRLGGQRSLRGFNELSVLATNYTYGNVEMRYLLAQHSFLFAFYNQAYLQYKTRQLSYTDFPLGFGSGINFETELGILSVSYALGKQRNIPLNLRQGKIHFGITALF